MYTFQRYTSKYIGILYNTENQFCSFVNVFNYKAYDMLLKEFLLRLGEQARQHQHDLKYIMKQLHLKTNDMSSDGMRGIFKDAFFMIEDTKDTKSVDDIMIFSLIQAGFYKLSHYHHILTLLRHKELTQFTNMIEQIILSEENAILELQEIQSSVHLDKFSKEAERTLVV